jgi:phosphohistidine swiveling domain-containing protein
MSITVPLESAASLGRRRIGGKALGLARLAERGLPVPPGLVIPVGAFRHFLVHNGLWESARQLRRLPDPLRARALRAAVRGASLPPALAAELRARAPALGEVLVVRSSGVAEDGGEQSWAGVFHTELGVRPGDALEAAVLRCWASAFDDRALAYALQGQGRTRLRSRLREGGAPGAGMALVVQGLVRARSSGVTFSVNAMTGSWRQMTVEACWGLGEALVGGHVVPDHYLVRRPRRLPEPLQRLVARVRLEPLERTVQPQESELVLGAEGVVWRPVPEHRQGEPKLDDEQLLALCRLALRAEATGGCPQDVEWAVDPRGEIWLLQSRPITTTAAPNRSARTLWTRRFIGERWSEPATPLGWSLVRPLLEHFIAYPRTTRAWLGGEPALTLVDGAPYINATVFRQLSFKLPGLPPPRFIMDMLPPDEERDWMARFAAAPGFRVYGAILEETFRERRWRRFRWNPFTNHRAWDELEALLEREVPRQVAPPPAANDPARALARVEAGMELARAYVKVHVTSLLFANLWYQVVEGLLAVWLGPGSERLAGEVLRCPEHNLTILTHHELWSLAQRAREVGADLDALPARGTPFALALDAFLERHGHRSDASWEIMSPRWAEHPERVLALLRHSLEAGEEDPRIRARALSEQGQRALDRLLLQVEQGPRRALLRYLVELTRRYLLLRENQRYHFDRLLHAVQGNYLLIGRWAVGRGALDQPEDIRFLEAQQVEALVAGHLEPRRALADARRRGERFARQRELSPPDFLVDGEAVAPDGGGRRLVGLGTSPGMARGPVRVVRDLEEAKALRPGEILVARAVDPGWTPLFPVAAGLVLELGSQLSHGAVVAREYELPMVVNVRGATQLLEDGQEVVMDGARGLVWIHG